MSNYENFSSLPPEKERDFVVFEKTSVETASRALRIGLITALSIGFLIVVVVLGVNAKPENKMAGDDMGMLKRADEEKKKAAEAKKAKEAAAAAEEAADTPDEAAGDEDNEDDSAGDDDAEGDEE